MEYYLIVSTVMMFVGIYGFVTRRNLLAMLISVELILNSVDINFVVFNRFLFPEQLEGFFFALFAIGISAAETAVAIAICVAASAPFLTPVGSGTNTLIVRPGNLKFMDFFRPGLGLTVVILIVSMIFIPIFWPL